MNVIRASWDRVPSNRPSFEKIARDLKKQRAEWSFQNRNSPKMVSLVDEWDAQNPHFLHRSPDILPRPLPGDAELAITQDTPGSGLGLDIGEDEVSSLSSVEELGEVAPLSQPVATPIDSMSTNTLTSDASIEPDLSVLASGYLSPPDPDDISAKYRDERRYRMLLQHEYHTIRGYPFPFLTLISDNDSRARFFFLCPKVTLPLWRPSHVELGAVGFLSKPEGRFETLFNAFEPGATSGGKADELPMLSGYGKVFKGSQRQDKRNAALRGLDRVHGLISSTYVQPSRYHCYHRLLPNGIDRCLRPALYVNQQTHQSHAIVPAAHPAQGGLHLRRVDDVPLHHERRGAEEVVPIQH